MARCQLELSGVFFGHSGFADVASRCIWCPIPVSAGCAWHRLLCNWPGARSVLRHHRGAAVVLAAVVRCRSVLSGAACTSAVWSYGRLGPGHQACDARWSGLLGQPGRLLLHRSETDERGRRLATRHPCPNYCCLPGGAIVRRTSRCPFSVVVTRGYRRSGVHRAGVVVRPRR